MRRTKRRGLAYMEALGLAWWLASFGAAIWLDPFYLEKVRNAELKDECKSNLTQLGKAIDAYVKDNSGRFPNLQVYPWKKDERDDPPNLLKVLRKYVRNDDVFICPTAPDPIQQTQVTYIWNDELSGKVKSDVKRPSSTWILADIVPLYEALPDEHLEAYQMAPRALPQPHVRGYNILYVDGTVKWSPVPPKVRVTNIPRLPFAGGTTQPGSGIGSGS